jgi:hypothetical protein
MRLEVPRTCRFGRSRTAWARATRRNTLAIPSIQRISVDRRQARVATRVLGRACSVPALPWFHSGYGPIADHRDTGPISHYGGRVVRNAEGTEVTRDEPRKQVAREVGPE